MLFKHFENAGLQLSWKTGQRYIILLVTSLWRHVTWDWSQILTQYPQFIQVYVWQVSPFSFALRRYCEKENRGKNMPPATGGWRGGPAAHGIPYALRAAYTVPTGVGVAAAFGSHRRNRARSPRLRASAVRYQRWTPIPDFQLVSSAGGPAQQRLRVNGNVFVMTNERITHCLRRAREDQQRGRLRGQTDSVGDPSLPTRGRQ